MEARVEQFHKDAQRPKDDKTPRDLEKLRKFLYKNQEYRFTEREQSHMFQAVQCYVTAYAPAGPRVLQEAEAEDSNPAAALLEDALKMPFTVFTTSHKKTMLKWLDKFSSSSKAGSGTTGGAGGDVWYLVIDLTDSTAEVMDKEGSTQTISLASVDTALKQQLKQLWEAEDEVRVRLRDKSEGLAITGFKD